MKRFVSLLLVLCLAFPTALAEEEKPKSVWDSIGGWFSQAAEDTADWASQAWDDTSEWAGQAWEDTSEWAGQAWKDTSEWATNAWGDVSAWATQAWGDVSAWTVQAWNDSSKWVSQAWTDSSNWAVTNWDHFIVWVNTVASGDPYSWVKNVVLDNGILAYDAYADVRSFLDSNPSLDQIHQKYDASLSELSLLNEDKDTLWNMIQQWSEENGLMMEQTSKLALPFLTRLLIEGEDVIGDGAEFSGPVVGQYLLTILEAMNLDSAGTADMRLKILHASLVGLTRPTIIGDTDQNTIVTDDHYYIENFTYGNGKYQIIMLASQKSDDSQYPLLRGHTLKETAEKYFKAAEYGETDGLETENASNAESLPFSYSISESTVEGKAVAIWAQNHYYLFFVISDLEWSDDEFDNWFKSISLTASNSITFEVDMESDGAFFGVNQSAQKYTINRIFDEEKFTVPKTGHGWAAERGNNLVDNLKGFIKRQHSVVKGDDNAKNGADRVTTFADGSRLLIQTKYYSTASRSISACFDENGFRYIDHVEGRPMAIEVPADQYQAALEYMKHRIANGEVKWTDSSGNVQKITDVDLAEEFVKKGNLTYQQAKHIAKAGTVESILYDSAHACVTAGTSMGLSAAVSFAINLWNGETVETAIKESILQGLQTGGTSFIISVLSSQVAKSGLNTAMIPASRVVVHALGPKVSAVIVNAFRPAGSAIYGAAAMQSAAKLLRGNVITSTVTFVVLSAGDVADIIQGRISWKQLAKNVSTTAVGVTGGALGWLGGAALGTAIMPGAGTVVGIICSVAAGWGANEGAKAVADMIAEDDADEMLRIVEEEFSVIASEYFLDEEEVNQSVTNLQALITPEMLKQMYQYRNHTAFARQMIEMAIDPVVAQRTYVELPEEDEYSEYLTDVLEAIYEDVSGETVNE